MKRAESDRWVRREGQTKAKRRPYKKPTIVSYGDVRRLTKGGAGSLPDVGPTKE